MKRILLAAALALAAGGQALAADLPQPAPPPPRAPATYVPVPVPVFSWTGIYFGINGGYGFGDSNWTGPLGVANLGGPLTGCCSTGQFSTSGFLVGGTLGANYQWGQFVLGIEGDGDWTNLNGTYSGAGLACGAGCTTQSDWLATVRGRAGYAFDRILIYGTGGAAFGNLQAGYVPTGTFDSSTQIGWTAGGGIEFAFTPNLTAKVEYLYVDLGSMSCVVGCGVIAATPVTVSLTENVVRAGINYKFW
ncbi:MAG: outer membrane protein [Steroidobacteraceae bacterium]